MASLGHAENVFVDEEVAAGELEPVEKAQEIEEERVATKAREETHAIVAFGDSRVRVKRDRCVFDEHVRLELLVHVAVL